MNTAAAKMPLVINADAFEPELNERIAKQLGARLHTARYYSREEIKRVTERQSALFPDDFVIDEETYERLRVLCTLSQCGLNGADRITSHRPIIGPLIVTCKRAAWRIIKAQLENTFNGIQEFCSWMVHAHAKLLLENRELRTDLERLERSIRQQNTE